MEFFTIGSSELGCLSVATIARDATYPEIIEHEYQHWPATAAATAIDRRAAAAPAPGGSGGLGAAAGRRAQLARRPRR